MLSYPPRSRCPAGPCTASPTASAATAGSANPGGDRLASGEPGPARPGSPGNGDTYTCLAAGSEIGIATAWRYVQEAITLLSAAADDLNAAMRRIRLLAYAILDGA